MLITVHGTVLVFAHKILITMLITLQEYVFLNAHQDNLLKMIQELVLKNALMELISMLIQQSIHLNVYIFALLVTMQILTPSNVLQLAINPHKHTVMKMPQI